MSRQLVVYPLYMDRPVNVEPWGWRVDLRTARGFVLGQVNAAGELSASLSDDSCLFASREDAETAAALYALKENA